MPLQYYGAGPLDRTRPPLANPVGRFRSGYVLTKRPAALTEWRLTTGDPEVAKVIHDLLGGDAPQEWEATGEDNLEVFTASNEVEIIIEGPKALRERMVLWGRNGRPISASDGESLEDGSPDPDADLSFSERKAKEGIGAEPDIEVFFRLAAEPDLGIFKFKTGSWSMASDLAYNATAEALADLEGPAKATLKLEEVSFIAKNGPRAGQTVNYTKPVLRIIGVD